MHVEHLALWTRNTYYREHGTPGIVNTKLQCFAGQHLVMTKSYTILLSLVVTWYLCLEANNTHSQNTVGVDDAWFIGLTSITISLSVLLRIHSHAYSLTNAHHWSFLIRLNWMYVMTRNTNARHSSATWLLHMSHVVSNGMPCSARYESPYELQNRDPR